MKLLSLKSFFLLLLTLAQSLTTQTRHRCRYGDPCWPDVATWQSFNNSISGRLVRTFPSAAVCHQQQYNATGCSEAKSEWTNSFWRTNQTGAYTAMAWELGNGHCFINSSRDDVCQPGLGTYCCIRWHLLLLLTTGIVPHYSVAAKNISDIQAGVKFANENDLYLVIKNTGHDQ